MDTYLTFFHSQNRGYGWTNKWRPGAISLKINGGILNFKIIIEIFIFSLLQNDFESIAINTKQANNHLPVVFGRTVDSLLQQLLDNALRDFVTVWIEQHTYDCNSLVDNLK